MAAITNKYNSNPTMLSGVVFKNIANNSETTCPTDSTVILVPCRGIAILKLDKSNVISLSIILSEKYQPIMTRAKDVIMLYDDL